MSLPICWDDLIAEVRATYRLDDMDMLIPRPKDSELMFAAEDAVADINLVPPLTNYPIKRAVDDANFRSLVRLGTFRRILRTIIADLTANSFSQQVNEFQLEDRLPEFQALFERVSQDFQDTIGPYKEAQAVYVRAAKYTPLVGGVVSITSTYQSGSSRTFR